MKRLFSLMALLTLLATGALADPSTTFDTSFIGIWAAQDEAAVCHMDVPLYTFAIMYFYAYAHPGELADDAVTAVEFNVENYPVAGAEGLVTPTWTSPLVIGNPAGPDFSVAWPLPQAGPWVLIGEVQLFATAGGWIPADTKLRIIPAGASGTRGIVDGDFVTHQVLGTSFWLNCSEPADCPCDQDSPSADVNWGAIKSLY